MNSRSTEKHTILVVDDKLENLDVLITYLEQYAFNFVVARSGEEVFKRLAQITPDVILLDVLMPGIDGFEVCRRLKQDEHTKAIPVIFMTALTDTVNKVRGFEIGGVDYITKPFQHAEVLARVNAHLTIRQQQQHIQEQNAALETQSLALLELNLKLQQEIRERQQAEAALEKANQELQRLASLDGLTQIANRRRFDEYLAQEWHRMAREQAPLALILGDIDYFKNYNDTYGHLAGDGCLQQVAQSIRLALKRPADLVARYGGEEFAVILPNTDAEGARHIAAAIQQALQQLQLPHAQSAVSPYVTLSLGVATTVPAPADSPEFLLNAADEALYAAKARGRNAIFLTTLAAPISYDPKN